MDEKFSLGPAVALGNEAAGEQPMSDQDRLQQCNAEIIAVLNKYGCELRAMPQTRAEGSIVIVDAVPHLVIRQR